MNEKFIMIMIIYLLCVYMDYLFLPQSHTYVTLCHDIKDKLPQRTHQVVDTNLNSGALLRG